MTDITHDKNNVSSDPTTPETVDVGNSTSIDDGSQNPWKAGIDAGVTETERRVSLGELISMNPEMFKAGIEAAVEIGKKDHARFQSVLERLGFDTSRISGVLSPTEKNSITASTRGGPQILTAISTLEVKIAGAQIINQLYKVVDTNHDKLITPEEGLAIAAKIQQVGSEIYGSDFGQTFMSSKLENAADYFLQPSSYSAPGGQSPDLGGISYERMLGQLSSYLDGVDASDPASVYKHGNEFYFDNPTVAIPPTNVESHYAPVPLSSPDTPVPSSPPDIRVALSPSDTPVPLSSPDTSDTSNWQDSLRTYLNNGTISADPSSTGTGRHYLFAGNKLEVPVSGVNAPDGYILANTALAQLPLFFEKYLDGQSVVFPPEANRLPVADVSEHSPPLVASIWFKPFTER